MIHKIHLSLSDVIGYENKLHIRILHKKSILNIYSIAIVVDHYASYNE